MAQTSTSLIQSLGLQPTLDRRQREAEQLGQARVLEGKVEAQRVFSRARQKKSTFQTIGALLGAAGGAIATGGSPQGAAAGAKVGGAIGGGASEVSSNVGTTGEAADAISSGFALAGTLQSLGSELELKKDTQDLNRFKTETTALKDLTEQGIYTTSSINNAIKGKDLSKLEVSNKTNNLLTKDQKELVFKRRNFITSSQEYKEPTDAINSANKVEELLGSDNPVAEASAIFSLSRAATGPGVLTENDLAPFKGSPAFFPQLDRVVEKAKTGKLTDDDRKFLRQTANILKIASTRNLNEFVSRESDLLLNTENISKDRLALYFEPLKRATPEPFLIDTGTDPILNNINNDSKLIEPIPLTGGFSFIGSE